MYKYSYSYRYLLTYLGVIGVYTVLCLAKSQLGERRPTSHCCVELVVVLA